MYSFEKGKKMKRIPGFHENIPFDDYKKWEADFSASEIKQLDKCSCMAEFQYRRLHPDFSDGAGRANGRIVDSLLSHRANPVVWDFEKSFIHLPANASKPAWNKKPENYTSDEKLYTAILKEAERTGREICLHEDFLKGTAQVESLSNSLSYGDLLENLVTNGVWQPSLVWQEKELRLLGKGRPDVYLPEPGILVDFKTTKDPVDVYTFSKTFFNYGYDIQAQVYARALKSLSLPFSEFIFVVIRNIPPYVCNVLRVPQRGIDAAEKKVDRLLAKLAQAIHNDEWPGHEGISEIIIKGEQ